MAAFVDLLGLRVAQHDRGIGKGSHHLCQKVRFGKIVGLCDPNVVPTGKWTPRAPLLEYRAGVRFIDDDLGIREVV